MTNSLFMNYYCNLWTPVDLEAEYLINTGVTAQMNLQLNASESG